MAKIAKLVKKSAGRKSEIVRVARHLFQTKKYDKTTMQDVMDALGIAKGTIYHYFKSKEALLEAVVEDIVDSNIEKMTHLLSNATGSSLEKIQMLVEAGNLAANHVEILDQLHRQGNESMHMRLLAATLVKQAPLYGNLIQQGCKEGIFETDFPLECAEFILSAIQFLTDLGIYAWRREDLCRRAQAFPRLVEQQLKAPVGSFHFLTKLTSPTSIPK